MAETGAEGLRGAIMQLRENPISEIEGRPLAEMGIGTRELYLKLGYITAEQAVQTDAILTDDGRLEPFLPDTALELLRGMEERARAS